MYTQVVESALEREATAPLEQGQTEVIFLLSVVIVMQDVVVVEQVVAQR
jgi:hypothetical protein